MKIPLNKLVHRDNFGSWLQSNGFMGPGVEIGTYYGNFASMLCSQRGGLLYTVDPYNWDVTPNYVDGCRRDWSAADHRELNPQSVKKAATEKLAPLTNCKMINLPSLEAVRMFPDEFLDFVFIDGDHSKESVDADLSAWFSKVKKGGVFAGHDFYNRDDELMKGGVFDAVWEWSHEHNRKPHVTQCTSWWFIK